MAKSYERILLDLFKSKNLGNIISLKIKGAEKALLTNVKEVKGNRIVVLNPISVYGAEIAENIFHVEDVEDCRVYNARYHDPVYVRIRELKNSIDQIRRNMNW
jgi:hypothetical protein